MSEAEGKRDPMELLVARRVEKMADRWSRGEYSVDDIQVIRAAKRQIELALLMGLVQDADETELPSGGDDE